MNKLIIVLVICFVLISLLVCCGAAKQLTYNEISYTVQPGDTLWDLHKEYGQPVRYHTWMAKMHDINGMHDGWLFAGEDIIILEVKK